MNNPSEHRCVPRWTMNTLKGAVVVAVLAAGAAPFVTPRYLPLAVVFAGFLTAAAALVIAHRLDARYHRKEGERS